MNQPPHPPHRVSVLIVGAGPVGLTAAALLTRSGVEVLLVERNMSTSDEPKAISLDDESLRTLKLAGLGPELDHIIQPGTGTQYHDAEGGLLFRAHVTRPMRFGHPFKNPFAQPELEAVLKETVLGRVQATVRFGTELRTLTQNGRAHQAELHDRQTGEHWSCETQFIVACDGGRSTVRELLMVGMTGRSYDEPWLVVDVSGDHHRERYGLHFGDPLRPMVVVPGANGRCRYEFRLAPGEGVPGEPPSFELIERLLAPQRSIAPDDVERAVVYRFNAVVADRWRVGPVFLAGDAAHMMPPFAGQGLNTGLRDVANLGWKLASVLDGSLADGALDTYESERRPQAEATVRLSEQLGQIVFTTSRFRAKLRDRVLHSALRTAPGRRYFEEMRYRPSSRVRSGMISGDLPRVGTLIEQPLVFDIGHHRPALLDEVLGTGWSLLGVDVEDDAWARCELAPLTRLAPQLVDVGVDERAPLIAPDRRAISDMDGRLEELAMSVRGRFLLIRPDRVICADFSPVEAAAVASDIARWQTPDQGTASSRAVTTATAQSD
jgi:3-(3-hydroxy-phenyl)propionate hydroxylase